MGECGIARYQTYVEGVSGGEETTETEADGGGSSGKSAAGNDWSCRFSCSQWQSVAGDIGGPKEVLMLVGVAF